MFYGTSLREVVCFLTGLVTGVQQHDSTVSVHVMSCINVAMACILHVLSRIISASFHMVTHGKPLGFFFSLHKAV